MTGGFSFRERVDAVRDKVDLVDLIGAAVKLGRGRNPRARCPFHGSKSDSLSIMAHPAGGSAPFAHCFGCGWHGDAIKFVVDYHGLDFKEALARLEADNGLDGVSAAPIVRARAPQAPRTASQERVESAVMGRFIWDAGRADHDAIRTYLRSRGVPDAMLADARLASIRFVAKAPIVAWAANRKPDSVPQAPAMAALVRRPGPDGWRAIGVHVTYLAPDLAGKMARERADGSAYPARKMLGGVAGGGVVLPGIAPRAPTAALYVGEGIETVLSGMALAGAAADDTAWGVAALSLDNLEGRPLLTKSGALPLHDLRADPERPALAFAHDGPVTGLIDADMAPLRGARDLQRGGWRGMPVIERRGAPVTMRTITPAERATICAELFVRNWRAAGCRGVAAMRPPMGMDFNDLGRAA